MEINGLNGASVSQLYQSPEQKTGGHMVQQRQVAQPPVPPAEEATENAAVQNEEAGSGGEKSETGSIDLYA